MSSERLKAWLATRPQAIQDLAKEFPFDTRFLCNGKVLYLVGYAEPEQLIVSETDPYDDYDAAVKGQFHMHAQCVRDSHEAFVFCSSVTTTARDDIQASIDAMMVDCGLQSKTRHEIEQEIRKQHGDQRAANYRRWSEPVCLRAEIF